MTGARGTPLQDGICGTNAYLEDESIQVSDAVSLDIRWIYALNIQ